MRMVKTLLLGSAASIVGVAGAQAADLPVKAKPVEYVKVCNLYGVGFYYVPGTDTCIQVGGVVRADYGWNVTGARTTHYSGTAGAQDRTVSPYSTRQRAQLSIDTRTQTAYGTVRTFEVFKLENENQGTVTPNVPRAFIQWAGFTFGHTKSFTDPFGGHGGGDFDALHQVQNQSDSGSNGTNQIAYTWELGNGNSLSVGGDERRTKAITNLSNAGAVSVGAAAVDSSHGMQNPTPWVTFKSIQSWGKWSLAAIGNINHATYYGAAPGIPGYAPGAGCIAQPLTTFCTSPSDKWGFAVLGGFEAKAFWDTPGSRFGARFGYSQGASAYGGGSNLASPNLFAGGNNVALGVMTDSVFVNGSALQLTTAWGVGAAYEHYWTRNFASTLLGSYTEVNYNNAVVASRVFCGGGGAVAQNINFTGLPGPASCDPSFKFWSVGSHTDWYPVNGFRLAIEAFYTNIGTAFKGAQVSLAKSTGARPTGVYTARDQGIVSLIFRAERRFPVAGDAVD